MAIKWSAVKVNDAINMAEEFVNQAAEPLEQARIVAIEARKIAHLPKYMDDRFAGLTWDIERLLERLKGRIATARKFIPEGAIDEERESTRHGVTQPLI